MFNVRAKFFDPGSAHVTATTYSPFTVTFTFICTSDVLSIDAIAGETFTLGDSALTTTVTTSQTEANCVSLTTLTYEAFDGAIRTWVLTSTQSWYQSESASSLTIYVNPSDSEDFGPSKDVTARVTYSSAYTASVSTTYVITFIDPCYEKPTSIDPSVLVDQEYTLTGTSVDYIFDAFTVDPPFCDIIYTYSLAEATGEPVVSVSDSRTFKFEYITDLDPLVDRLALFKDYTVSVTGTAGLLT